MVPDFAILTMITETDPDSATCSVWFDISRTKLPRPLRFPAVEDVFKHIRAKRKWFKNVRLYSSELPSLPPRADESGNLSRLPDQEAFL